METKEDSVFTSNPSDKSSSSTYTYQPSVDDDLINLDTPEDTTDKHRDGMYSNVPTAGDNDDRKVDGTDHTDMMTSHAESGYLTDSVTSRSRDCHMSISSESDKTPCHEGRPSLSSDTDKTPCRESVSSLSNDRTPCKENLTSYDDFQPTRKHVPYSNSAVGIMHSGDRDDCQNQLEAIAQMSLSVDKNCSEIDEIFTSNFAPVRPESLGFVSKNQKSELRTRSKSDYNAFENIAVPEQMNSKDEQSDYRKRSKSSGFPIPRLREGLDFADQGLSRSLPQGQIVRSNTGLIEFIADDLQEKIRRSSPMSKTASSDVSSRRSSLTSVDSFASSTVATSMTSGMSRSFPQSPDSSIPPIDPMAIHEIENQARLVADNLDHMMGNLRNNLHKMSAISVGCEEAYRTSVDVTCDSVDSSIKSMYALMAKCEELSMTMKPVYRLADQIKEIKRLLDRFESQLVDKS